MATTRSSKVRREALALRVVVVARSAKGLLGEVYAEKMMTPDGWQSNALGCAVYILRSVVAQLESVAMYLRAEPPQGKPKGKRI